METQLILIRHGQTESNRSKKIQGQSDSALSQEGKVQSQRVANKLRRYNLSAIYTSSLGRAKHTAEIISQAVALPYQEDRRLIEIGFGELEGLEWEFISRKHPQLSKLWRNHHNDARMPGGESRAEALLRFKEALEEIVSAHAGKSIAIVTHGGLLASLFVSLLNIPNGQRPMCIIDNTSINIISIRDQNWRIKTWGDTSHLL